jgi:outer membrane protein
MKKGIIVTALVLGLVMPTFAENVAVVDVQAVVSQSQQVKALKQEQTKKMQDLEKWLNTVKADVENQKTQEGKEKLIKKYNADFAKKKEAIAKDYQTRIQAIDKSITDTIAQQAKAKGYDIVISKGAVLYGGDDITADINKVVK